MKRKLFLALGITAFLIFISAGMIFAQESSAPAETSAGTQSEPETQWVWGEIGSVDAQNKAFSVKYLDYETDQEKEMLLGVDEKTTYENIKSLEEVKPNDTVSIDYIVSPEGKNIAKNISVEKAESIPVPAQEPAPAETTPQDLQQTSPSVQE